MTAANREPELTSLVEAARSLQPGGDPAQLQELQMACLATVSGIKSSGRLTSQLRESVWDVITTLWVSARQLL